MNNYDIGSTQYFAVKFDNANTAASPTLSVNSGAAKSIMTNGVNAAYWSAGATVNFWYDGTNYQVASSPVYASEVTVGNPSGDNVHIGNSAVEMRNGSTVLAAFGAAGATIGQDGENRAIIDAASFQIIDSAGTVQFRASSTGSSKTGTMTAVNMLRRAQTIKRNLSAVSGDTISYSIEDASTGTVLNSGSFTSSVGEKHNGTYAIILVTSASASGTTVRIDAKHGTSVQMLRVTLSWQTTYDIPIIETIGDCKVGEDLYIENTKVEDFIIAQGTSSNWRYRKWSSGFIEAWYESTATASATTAVSISSRTVSYRSTWSTTIPSAIGFTSTPKIIVSLGSSSDIRTSINGAASSTTAIDGYCWRSSSSSSTYDITPRIYAWGS